MRVTKREHATLVVDDGGRRLVIDPGSFTGPLPDVRGVDAVVVTHQHADHVTDEHIRRIRAAAGPVPVFAPEGVAQALPDLGVHVVRAGDTAAAGPFRLEFFGGAHAVIHSSIPVVDNVGVFVDDALYYPGDSYAVPQGRAVQVLAAPVGAPWLKIGEAMDFVLAVAPRRAFGTHDMTLSPAGLQMGRERLEWAVRQHGGTFLWVDPGDSFDV